MSPLRQIEQQLAAYPARPLELAGLRPAAVLIPLSLRDGEPWVLFTRRTERLKKHAGEISFPGGGAEAGDGDFWQTALRETEEEIGLRRELVRPLGQLDDFVSVHGYRVRVYVGSYPYPYCYRLDENEVAELIELPLSVFRDPAIYHQEDWRHKGRSCPVDFYRIGGRTIWGLTAAILKQLLERVASGRSAEAAAR